MATITYQFIKTHEGIILRSLEFEGSGTGVTGTTGTVTRNITGLLDINVRVEGDEEAIGKTWSLIVRVNNQPIITASANGVISARITKSGRSTHQSAHSWYI